MKISFMIGCLSRYIKSNELSLEQVFTELRGMGLDGIEVSDSSVVQVGGRRFKDLADAAGLDICAYDIICDLVTTDPLQRIKVVDDVERSMELAASLDCTRVLIVPGVIKPGLTPEHTRELIAEGLRDCVKRANKLNIVPMIEDFGMPNTPFATSGEMLEVLDLVGEGLKVTFDTGNFLIGDEDPVEALEALRDHVYHVHVKDMVSGSGNLRSYSGTAFRATEIGEGIVDLKSILEGLKGYEDYLSLELYINTDDIMGAVERGIDYLMKLKS
jgi:sugar phosphate isomerase/epimerase